MANQSWRDLYPFESKQIQIGGHMMHYIEQGSGDPALMIHGNPTWSFYYRNLVRHLSDSHRAIAIDHIGCGLSEKPADFEYSLERHIQNLVEFIELNNLSNINLLVHDWGGAIGLGAAVKMPERFSRLILFNTAAFPPPYIPRRIQACRIPVLGTLAVRGFNLFAWAAVYMATEQKGGLPRPVAKGMLAPYDSWSNRVAIDRFVKDIPANKTMQTWQRLEQIESTLQKLSHLPIQIIWGMMDWCFRPECLSRFEQHFQQAQVHRIQTAGHYVIEDAPEQVCDLVKTFLHER
jgi:cis-3-alkyl-4-acyloxetan-2-one decarboxylase